MLSWENSENPSTAASHNGSHLSGIYDNWITQQWAFVSTLPVCAAQSIRKKSLTNRMLMLERDYSDKHRVTSVSSFGTTNRKQSLWRFKSKSDVFLSQVKACTSLIVIAAIYNELCRLMEGREEGVIRRDSYERLCTNAPSCYVLLSSHAHTRPWQLSTLLTCD